MNVDWFITNLCDQTCGFCYAPRNAFPTDAPVEQALAICDRLIDLRASLVTICGGEPQLYPALPQVLDRLSQSGIRIVLYTNAIPERPDFPALLNKVSILSLPVDAVTPSVVSRMRGPHQFKRVQEVLAQLDASTTSPPVKIGTVVTRQNIGDLEAVGNFLARYRSIATWRLYQFSPYGRGRKNQQEFLISEQEFNDAVFRATHTSKPFRVSVRSRSDNRGYCLIMDSRGSFYRYEESYVPLGATIFNEPSSIMRHYDLKKHLEQKSWAA